jgi:flagellar motor switch protein FliM
MPAPETPGGATLAAALALGPLRHLARGRTSAVRTAGQAAAAVPFDPRSAGQPSGAQMQGLDTLRQACALALSETLGALLRGAVDAQPAAVEQVPAGEFLEPLPAACLAPWGRALGATALLQLDGALLWALLDRVLGGSGPEAPEDRPLTEIEQEIFEPVLGRLGQTLRESWRPAVALESCGARPLGPGEASALLAPGDPLLLLTFALRLGETAGRLRLAFPSAVAGALLRQFAPREAPPAPSAQRASGRLRERLFEARFQVELRLPRSSVSIGQLCSLRPGDVLPLEVPCDAPLPVHVEGHPMFLAAPVRCGNHRGAQVRQVLSIAPGNPVSPNQGEPQP